jgi:hypothetical protein
MQNASGATALHDMMIEAWLDAAYTPSAVDGQCLPDRIGGARTASMTRPN